MLGYVRCKSQLVVVTKWNRRR